MILTDSKQMVTILYFHFYFSFHHLRRYSKFLYELAINLFHYKVQNLLLKRHIKILCLLLRVHLLSNIIIIH